MSEENKVTNNELRNRINLRMRASRSRPYTTNRLLRSQLNPIFGILGVDAPSRTYADVVRENLNLNQLRLGNNVVPRERVRDALHDILDEIEAIREQLTDHSYLKISNNLRTVYDYITQYDEPTNETFIDNETSNNTEAKETEAKSDIQDSPVASENNQETPSEENLQNQSSFILTATIRSLDDRFDGVNAGIVTLFRTLAHSFIHLASNNTLTSSENNTPEQNLSLYQKYRQSIYAAIKWTIIDAPARQLWQIIIITCWTLFVFVFGLIHILVAGIESITRTTIKKIIVFGILILEEILQREQVAVQNVQLGILYVIIVECLRICRQRITQIL